MNTTHRLRKALATLSVLSLLGVAAACGSEPESELATGGWDEIVKAAKEEGSVTIYSSQGQTQLDDLAASFEKEYGIKVEVVRGIDPELQPKIEAEKQTGKAVADVYVSSLRPAQDTLAEQGYYVAPEGPTFDELDVMQGKEIFDIDATVLTFAWNTDEFSGKVDSYTDLLDPARAAMAAVMVWPDSRTSALNNEPPVAPAAMATTIVSPMPRESSRLT